MQDEILEALRRGDAAAAVDAARARVDAAPDDADALRLLALALRAAGDVEGAREAIDRAIAQVPDDARLHLAQAALSIGSRDLEAARASLQAATGVDPNQFAAYVMQGHLAAVGDDLDEAARLAALAARVDPEHPALLALEGTIALRRGDAERAVQRLAAAVERAPGDRLALHALGCAYLERGHLAFAEQAFRRLLAIAPDAPSVRIMVAQLALKQGRPVDALEELGPLLADPQAASPQLRRFAGELELAAGRPDRAVAHLREALAALPGDRHVLAASLEAWGRAGDIADARRTLDALLATHPEHDATWRARLSLESGMAADALVADWRRHRPDSLEALDAEMTLHGAAGRIDEAEAVAQALLEREPGHARAEMRVVDALMTRDPGAALARLERLVQEAVRPADREALKLWRALAEHHAGDHAAALADWTRRSAEEAPSRRPRPALTAAPASWPDAAPAAGGTDAVFLVGLPGALAERAARLLGPALPQFRADRFSARPPADAFQDPRAWPRIASGEVPTDAAAASWRSALATRGAAGPVIDWLPWWDHALTATLRASLPGARLVVLLRDPRDMLLDWMAFGAQPALALESPVAAAEWLAAALDAIATLHERALVPHALVRIDDAIDDPRAMARLLSAAIGAALPEPPASYFGPRRLTTGIWRAYAGPLAAAFEALAPVARRFGYPEA